MDRYCSECKIGEYRGYKPRAVSTVYFWCPLKKHHNPHQLACDKFVKGEPSKIDIYGNKLLT